MAWNGRTVKTYGRQKQRVIKKDAWISPDIKSTDVNVFSSPDTDISVTSNTEIGRYARQTRQGRLSNLLDSPYEISCDKENVLSLAPETPEEEQGSRRRGALRNARVIRGRQKQQENTPNLFSSDSDDGLRKKIGRKALLKAADMNVVEPVINERNQRSKRNISKATKKNTTQQSKRVKSIIANDSYTIIRSPPPKLMRSGKRHKTCSDLDANISLSPFAMMESWIEVVAATSTPMVELVKLDNRRKVVSLDNSVFHESIIEHCCAKKRGMKTCNCGASCTSEDDVTDKLCSLRLSDGEEDNDDKETKTGDPKRNNKYGGRLKKPSVAKLEEVGKGKEVKESKRVLRARKNVNYNQDSDSENSSESHKTKSCAGKEPNKPQRRTRLAAAISKEDSSQLADVSSTSSVECSVVLNNLSCHDISSSLRSPSVCLNVMSEDAVSPHLSNTDIALRGLSSKDVFLLSSSESSSGEQCDLKEDSSSSRLSMNCSVALHPISEKMLEMSIHDSEEENTRGARTRGQSKSHDPNNHSKYVKGTQVTSQTEHSDNDEDVRPNRTLRTRGQSQSENSEDSESTNVRKTRNMSENSNASEDAGITTRMRTRGKSQTEDSSEESSSTDNKRITRRQAKNSECDSREEEEEEEDQEEEMEFPVTPQKKHLSSFHMDSFKEVFTPKKHRDTGLVITGREKVLQQCEQTEPISFTDCIKPAMLKKCTKIGEGVYGEVFRTTNRRKQKVALKIIPIEGDFDVNEEPQKTFDEILPEIVISRELSYLSEGETNYSCNFIGVNRVSCCQGQYPKALLNEWDKYDDRKGSENDRPDIFGDDQLYIVFEFADGGKDLESFEFANLQQAISLIQQVAGALAVAERELEFEHRDLHWGNVLIRSTRKNQVEFCIGDVNNSVESHGLEVSIIDFTLSRLQKDDCTVFCDLSVDPTLFEGTGDYQFEIYRKMKEENGNNWEPFNPYTNVLWLHYTIDKLLKNKIYHESNGKAHRSALSELRSFSRHLLTYESAEQVVNESDLFDL